MSLIILLAVIFCLAFGTLKYNFLKKEERYIDHIKNSQADSSIGLSEIPEDRIVDSHFTSHLPLIIIDTNGEEIINYKRYNSETNAFEEPEGVDTYCAMQISVIDNDNHINVLSDPVSVDSLGKIKIRGNNSSSTEYPKFQYSIKLLDEEGNSNKESLLGLGEESSWIINPTIKDSSYIRNYLVYNIAGQIEPFQSDVRYCEVLFKNGDNYEYHGLYMLYEPVRVSQNRVNINKNESKYNLGLGYLLRKDRFDRTGVTLNTWATENGYYDMNGNGKLGDKAFFTLEYPQNENVTQAMIEDITNSISEIEKILYSEDKNKLATIGQYLDLESFADYFIINEFFGNYDAGMYSTYMYKSPSGKLVMGPYWDFDGAMDNSALNMVRIDSFVLQSYPWFNNLMETKNFVELVENRYRELRSSILDETYINNFIEATQKYLGNAILRDRSTYHNFYYNLLQFDEVETGLTIDRRRYSVADETQRVKDYLHDHGDYMDKHIEELEGYVKYYGQSNTYNSLLAFGFIIVILICSVLAQRYRYLK